MHPCRCACPEPLAKPIKRPKVTRSFPLLLRVVSGDKTLTCKCLYYDLNDSQTCTYPVHTCIMYNLYMTLCISVTCSVCQMKLVPHFLSGGLVHRSNAASSSGSSGATGGASEASGWGPPGAEKNPDLPDQDDEGYDDKSEDSKTMRLTLMEEVLLLGIKDREVSTYLALEATYRPTKSHALGVILTHFNGISRSHASTYK